LACAFLQTFFINGRLIRSRTAAAALEEAYKGTVMTGRFPACVLCLALSPSLVDVNVHPAKLEVRFANEKQIFDAVYYAVKNAVAALDTPPEMKLKPPAEMLQLKASLAVSAPQRSTFSPHARDPFGSAAFVRTPDAPKPQMSIPLSAERETGMNLASTVHPVYEPLSGKTRSGAESAPPRAGGEAPEQSGAAAAQGAVPQGAVPAARVIGQCFSTYIVVESGGELLLIDKHAAHERIIYEQLKKSGASCAQQLIEPLTIEFTPEEHEVLAMNLPLLAKAGFEAEDFGGRSLIVRSVPPYLAAGEAAAVLTETAAGLAAGRRELAPQKLDELYHSVACRAAVKGGDRTGADELASIAERVLAIGDIRYCPHGRPVVIAIKRADIEKQFGRRG
jgi:DNA mismatch repair protein MutL